MIIKQSLKMKTERVSSCLDFVFVMNSLCWAWSTSCFYKIKVVCFFSTFAGILHYWSTLRKTQTNSKKHHWALGTKVAFVSLVLYFFHYIWVWGHFWKTPYLRILEWFALIWCLFSPCTVQLSVRRHDFRRPRNTYTKCL